MGARKSQRSFFCNNIFHFIIFYALDTSPEDSTRLGTRMFCILGCCIQQV